MEKVHWVIEQQNTETNGDYFSKSGYHCYLNCAKLMDKIEHGKYSYNEEELLLKNVQNYSWMFLKEDSYFMKLFCDQRDNYSCQEHVYICA